MIGAQRAIAAVFRGESHRRGIEVSEKIGTGRRAIIDAEGSKASTGAGVYAVLL